jgi:hypothetical protein
MGKACFGLTIPADADLWTSDEVDIPARERDFVRLLSAPNILVSGTVRDGIVRAVNHGSSHHSLTATAPGDPNYRKILYSTVSAPGYESADLADVGSTSTLLAARRVLIRKDFQRLAGGRTYAASRWIARNRDQRSQRGKVILAGVVRPIINRSSSPVLNLVRHRFRPIDDLHEAESHSVLFGQIEVRVTYRRSPTPIRVRDSGALVSSDDPSQILSSTSDTADPVQWASVKRADGLTSTVVCLLGVVEPAVFTYEGVCPFGGHSRVPALTEVEMSTGEVTMANALLLGGSPPAAELIARDFTLTVLDPRLLQIHRGLTQTCCWLALGEETCRRLVVGGSELAGFFRFVRTERDEIADVVGSTYRLTDRRDR